MINLISVYGTAEPERTMYERFMFEQLAERKSYMNISHREMPTYDEHVKYIRDRTHKHWYIIQLAGTSMMLGNVYISYDNEIGIYIKEGHYNKGYGKRTLSLLLDEHHDIKEFKANIAPFNGRSICFFVNNGFVHHHTLSIDDKVKQYQYRMINPYYRETKTKRAV